MDIDRAQNVARIDIGLVYQAPLVVEVPGLDGSPMPQKSVPPPWTLIRKWFKSATERRY